MSAPRNLHSDPAFQDFCKRELKPLEDQFEGHRTGAHQELFRRAAAALAGIAAAVAIGIWLMEGDTAGTWGYFVMLLVAAVLLGVWAAVPVMAHIGRLKVQVMPRLVSFFGDLTYQWSPELSLDQFKDSGILPRYNKCHVEDLVQGTRSGVSFAAAEIRLSYERRVRRAGSSSTSTTTDTVFKGLLASITTGARYPGTTVVGTRGSFKGYFEIREDSGLHPQDVDDEHFGVFASDQAADSVVADAQVRERLAQLTHLFRAEHIVAGFSGSRVVMLIAHEGDYFEISTREETDFARDAETVGQQLQRILEMVDRLDLPPAEPGSKPIELTSEKDPIAEAGEGAFAAGGWGCLWVFFLWMGCSAAAGIALRTSVEGVWLLPASSGAGLLVATGLFQAQRSVKSGSVGGLVLAALLLGGAAGIIVLAV